MNATNDRPAARVVCLDHDGRVLLMHWYDRVSRMDVWEPPGGGIDPGELTEEEREAYLGYAWAEELPEAIDPPELAKVVERLVKDRR
ncbi:NUDIX domain-containing protein [Nonomuraea basaltis]|uniref:NUDIX domain-containing protein n=1 Tax=Nonomuraea basaltis TaxID=2495887 RepID=UPI00110C58CD|nr:NUDIX domain-containing protein [Nonomuraea basaltis]TMR93360.1 hypothetical protein EJK15_39675 [Nonomuraea basaltis]